MSAIRFGIDVLREQNFAPLKNKRVGLFSNAAATDKSFITTLEILHAAENVNLVALFGPEHGFSSTAAEGQSVGSMTDSRTGLPIYSLYGENYAPTHDALRDLDIIVCDIQDIGVRYYTYSWTLTHIMDVAAAAGTQIMVLDRPNPLGGENVSGLSLDPELASLVGRYPIPICHGLTLGELATLVNDLWITGDVDLVVVQCDGWQRKMRWADTRLNWIPTSPNMPHIETVLHYPGACLIEGTNLSEGRGTALPFEIVGAPFIADDWLANELNAHDWHGVKFRPCAFHPYRSKWQDIECRGVQAHITDVDKYEPIRVWLDVIQTIRHAYPDDFAWNISHFDRLIGNREVRTMIDRGGDVRKLNWHDDVQQFRELCRPYLLYD